MEQKKSQRANLDDKRLTGFLIGLVVTLSLFLAALQYTTGNSGNKAKEPDDEETPDVDLLPKPKRSDMIAVIQPKPKKPSTQKLKIVKEKEQAEKLNNITQMRTIETPRDRDGTFQPETVKKRETILANGIYRIEHARLPGGDFG